jgi:hypothetical protein
MWLSGKSNLRISGGGILIAIYPALTTWAVNAILPDKLHKVSHLTVVWWRRVARTPASSREKSSWPPAERFVSNHGFRDIIKVPLSFVVVVSMILLRRIVLSKPVTSRGWVRAVCVVPVLAVVAVALLALSPALHRGKASTAAAGSVASQTIASQTIASQTSADTAAARGRIQSRYAALPLAFEPNQGQTDASVKYMAHGNGYTLFLTATDAVFSLHSLSGQTRPAQTQPAQNALAKRLQLRAARTGSTAVVRMQLEDANSQAQVAASGLLPGKSNYFLGSDSGKWRNDVARYARVSYRDVYPGVNLAYYGAQSQLEFDFVVAPGANPAPIGLHFTGARGLKTDGSGNLIIASAAGDVLLRKPVAYQEQNGARQSVDARFALKANNQISFELGHYDRSRELVIDPTISYEYSTYLGGNGNDSG